jgi:hypothetical protein
MHLSSEWFFLFFAPQYYNGQCFTLLRILNKQVALGVGSTGIQLTVESPWMSVTTHACYHVVRYSFWLWRQSGICWYDVSENNRNSTFFAENRTVKDKDRRRLIPWVVTLRNKPEARRHHPHGGTRLKSRRSDAPATLMMNMTSSRMQRKVAWQQLAGETDELL